MSWLVGTTLASMVAAFVVVRLLDYVLSGMVGAVVGAAKASAFASVWTAVTTGSGMRAFSQRVQAVRQGIRDAGKRMDPRDKRR